MLNANNKQKLNFPELGMKRNKRKVPGGGGWGWGCTGVAGWERLEGCWLDRGAGCAAGRGERSADERGRRTAEEVAGWNRGIVGMRNHWSWEGTGNPGERHGVVTRGKKIIQ